MLCVYCIYNYVNKFEARSLFSTAHLKLSISVLLMFVEAMFYLLSV